MNKLMRANFFRLRRSRMFALVLIGVLLFSMVIMLNDSRQAGTMRTDGYAVSLDKYYFRIFPFLGIFIAVFISLFLGEEYSDGTLRNKIIAGHRRRDIYLAQLFTCMAVSFCFVIAGLAGGLAGVPLLGLWQMEPQALLIYALLGLCSAAALSAVFTLAGMLFSNRALGAVAAILLFFVQLLCASAVYNRLCEPEMFSGIVITAEGLQMGEPTANPNYIAGTLRTLYVAALNILPTGQSILQANLEVAHPLLQAAASLAVSLTATAAGLTAFSKKDIR